MELTKQTKAVLQRWGNAALDALFPRFCVFCGAEGGLVCPPCEKKTPSLFRATCPVCGTSDAWTTCLTCKDATPLLGVRSFYAYADPAVRRLIEAWKYTKDADAARVIESWVHQREELPLWHGFVVTHVPLHEQKRRSRGFDQAKMFADIIAQTHHILCVELLERMVYTKPQATYSHAKRQDRSWQGVFRAIPPVPERVLLCDDVYTTGGTMSAAARVLKAAGAKEIWGLTLARG